MATAEPAFATTSLTPAQTRWCPADHRTSRARAELVGCRGCRIATTLQTCWAEVSAFSPTHARTGQVPGVLLSHEHLPHDPASLPRGVLSV